MIEGGGIDPALFTGALAAPLARAWKEEEEEEEDQESEEGEEGEGEGEEGEEDGAAGDGSGCRRRNPNRLHHCHLRHHQLFRRPPAAGGPPAIVPILVTMEPSHQALLVREACERDPGLAAAAGAAAAEAEGGGDEEERIERAVARAAAAARHVEARAAAAAPAPPPLVGARGSSDSESPVVLRVATSLRAGDAERAVARLHAALLGLMEAMEVKER